MEKITIPIGSEDEPRSIDFTVSQSHDILIADNLKDLPMEREEYIMQWLHEKTNSICKLGCEWRLFIPHAREGFAQTYGDVPEELDDIFHAAFIRAQELHIETGESMILVLYTEI